MDGLLARLKALSGKMRDINILKVPREDRAEIAMYLDDLTRQMEQGPRGVAPLKEVLDDKALADEIAKAIIAHVQMNLAGDTVFLIGNALAPALLHVLARSGEGATMDQVMVALGEAIKKRLEETVPVLIAMREKAAQLEVAANKGGDKTGVPRRQRRAAGATARKTIKGKKPVKRR